MTYFDDNSQCYCPAEKTYSEHKFDEHGYCIFCGKKALFEKEV